MRSAKGLWYSAMISGRFSVLTAAAYGQPAAAELGFSHRRVGRLSPTPLCLSNSHWCRGARLCGGPSGAAPGRPAARHSTGPSTSSGRRALGCPAARSAAERRSAANFPHRPPPPPPSPALPNCGYLDWIRVRSSIGRPPRRRRDRGSDRSPAAGQSGPVNFGQV